MHEVVRLLSIYVVPRDSQPEYVYALWDKEQESGRWENSGSGVNWKYFKIYHMDPLEY